MLRAVGSADGSASAILEANYRQESRQRISRNFVRQMRLIFLLVRKNTGQIPANDMNQSAASETTLND
jgi:hypothetical protein